jgi:hypothetical protein
LRPEAEPLADSGGVICEDDALVVRQGGFDVVVEWT